MRNSFFIFFFLLMFLYSCKKEDGIPTSGTATINNIILPVGQSYYIKGFLFSKAELVSNLSSPPPDIIVDGDGNAIFLTANNFKNSFFKAGEYSGSEEAGEAFVNLVSPVVSSWEEWANPLKPHQVWIYRSGSEHYAKIRIISTVAEVRDNRDYAECTFEWVYQPDGSLTFPAE